MNETWLQAGFHTFADFQPSGCLSDHAPCIVSLFQQDVVKGKHFNFFFFNMWADHLEFQNRVATSCDQLVHGPKQYILSKKLQRLKGVLKELNRRDFAPGKDCP